MGDVIKKHTLVFKMITGYLNGISPEVEEITCVNQKGDAFFYSVKHRFSDKRTFLKIEDGVVSPTDCDNNPQSSVSEVENVVKQEPCGATGPKPHPADVKKITNYFSEVTCAKIESIQLLLGSEFGQVYHVKFVNSEFQSCYAVVTMQALISGYETDFWTNSDKYHLVLKHHIGQLVVDGEISIAPRQQECAQEDPIATVKPSTVDSIVELYEKRITDLEDERAKSANEYADFLGREKQRRMIAEEKLEGILKILSGKKDEPKFMKLSATPEECMIDQDSKNAFNDNTVAAGYPDLPAYTGYSRMNEIPTNALIADQE